MIFLTGVLIFLTAAIAVTYKVLLGYTQVSVFVRLAALFILTLSWLTPFWLRMIRHVPFLSGDFYHVAYKLGYFMMGFVLILFIILFVRDIVWQLIYFVSRIQVLNPDNVKAINTLNIVCIFLAFVFSIYGLYEAHKEPRAREINIVDSRIKKELKIVVASDFHINRSMPDWHIQKIIKAINKQNPDYILLVGDVVDDEPQYTLPKFRQLSALKAKQIYISLGNHEFYNKPHIWVLRFADLGFNVMHNRGETIEDAGVYVAGVPDVESSVVFYDQAFKDSSNEYKILMSHSPTDFKKIDKTMFDVQVSGHTHGGQIFPFQFIVKKANDYLEGLYEDGGAKLFVSRGAGYWGPPMRILAEPDILVMNLKPENNK